MNVFTVDCWKDEIKQKEAIKSISLKDLPSNIFLPD